MSEQTQTETARAAEQRTRRKASQEVARSDADAPAGPLVSERGTTTLDDAVVTKIAAISAREVGGVHDLGGGLARRVGAVTGRVGVADEHSRGVSVEIGTRQAAVDLALVIDYGESIPEVSAAVRDNVTRRIEGITGLEVTEVNITVNDLYVPGDDDSPDTTRVA